MVLRPTIEAAAIIFSMLAFDILVAKAEDDIRYVVQTCCAIVGDISDPLAEPGLVLTLSGIIPRRSGYCRSSWDRPDRADRVRQFLEKCVQLSVRHWRRCISIGQDGLPFLSEQPTEH
jgi:hypothetical protein